MELRRYIPLLLLILFVWITIIGVFVFVGLIIIPWYPPQQISWTIINFLTTPYQFDQGQLGFWSSIRQIFQVVSSGSLVLVWLYTWYELSKKIFWRDMKKKKLS
ncbi:MAG: hypothetical protein WED07_11040 [Candidatus Freyarchaeum deiterrae]